MLREEARADEASHDAEEADGEPEEVGDGVAGGVRLGVQDLLVAVEGRGGVEVIEPDAGPLEPEEAPVVRGTSQRERAGAGSGGGALARFPDRALARFL